MHRIDSDGAIDGHYTNGNGSNIPATAIDAAHLNAMQDEIISVIEHFGITLEKGTNTQLLSAILAGLSQQLPAPGGYVLSNNVTTPDTHVDIAAGSIIDSTRTTYLAGSALTKRIDQVFSAGNNGGLRPVSVALQANKTYHLFVILLSGGGMDYAVDTDIAASHIVADLDPEKWSRVGFLITDENSHISRFIQHGPFARRVTVWKTPLLEIDATVAGGGSWFYQFNRIPHGIRACVGITAGISAGHLRVSSPDQDDYSPGYGKSNVNEKTSVVVFSNTTRNLNFYASTGAHFYCAVEYVIDSLGE